MKLRPVSADNKGGANWIEEDDMERRFNRSYVRFPVHLESTDKAEGFGAPAGVMDMSEGGLRVHTGMLLIPGRLIHVFLEGSANPFASCRVVWAHTHGGALPSEAGLEILEHLADVPGSRLIVPPLGVIPGNGQPDC